MRILFIGDIVGKPGIEIVTRSVPVLRRDESLDFVIANGENADAGSGITAALYRQLRAAGVDCVTLGDHAFRKKEIIDTLESRSDIIRPANFPREAPGKGWALLGHPNSGRIAVINLIGRVFMNPADCPFHAIDRILGEIPPDVTVRIIDFHAEATSDKQLMGRHVDGRVSAVIGTHTHVPTADETVLPGGTAFICDAGMSGPHDSILGRDRDAVMEMTYTFRPRTFHVASKDNRLNGVLLDIDQRTGKARSIRRFRLDERQADALEDGDDR